MSWMAALRGFSPVAGMTLLLVMGRCGVSHNVERPRWVAQSRALRHVRSCWLVGRKLLDLGHIFQREFHRLYGLETFRIKVASRAPPAGCSAFPRRSYWARPAWSRRTPRI